MTRVLTTILLCLSMSLMTRTDTLLIMFWNVENFFDYRDGGAGESDTEFSPRGAKHWTKRKFTAKCNSIAKTILWIGGEYGKLPDIIGLAEVENRFVLNKLLDETSLFKLDYKIIHYDSPDRRGIDVALLYRAGRLDLISSAPLRVPGLDTRDILFARFRKKDHGSQVFSVLVNHHPSKYGGGETHWRREAAIGRLKSVCDSLITSGEENIIVMGDFNETPENAIFRNLPLINLAQPLSEKGEGTIRFAGKRELIDMFFVSETLENARMEIITVPYLMTRDNVHSGDKPLRTYTGPKYTGGVSDHKPIILEIPPEIVDR